jgi:hypothetical protein
MLLIVFGGLCAMAYPHQFFFRAANSPKSSLLKHAPSFLICLVKPIAAVDDRIVWLKLQAMYRRQSN